MASLTLLCHGKINWMLRVLGRRNDGYHELETLFQSVSLHDLLTIREASSFSFHCSNPSIPAGNDNLVVRAARAVTDDGTVPPVAIELDKRIPAGGGLGGGSADAALALMGINELLRLGRSRDELEGLALSLGSDVPFFLVGGTAWATGRGEKLVPMESPKTIPLLFVFPEFSIPTNEAFAWLDRTSTDRFEPPMGLQRCRAAVKGGMFSHAEHLINDFEEPVFARHPELGAIKKRLVESGASWSAMTGSGSTMVGAYPDRKRRDRAAASMNELRTASGETIDRARAVPFM